MAKRNKVRYQAKVQKKILLVLSGKVYLRYQDEEAIAQAVRGDIMVYPRCESLQTTRQGDYYSTGFSGYFKLDVHDGKEWRLVLLQDIFPDHENHFSKTECPIDTYELIVPMLQAWAGKNLQRTYREHYEPEESADEEPKA